MCKSVGSVVIILTDTRINRTGGFTRVSASGFQRNCSESLHKKLMRRRAMKYFAVCLV